MCRTGAAPASPARGVARAPFVHRIGSVSRWLCLSCVVALAACTFDPSAYAVGGGGAADAAPPADGGRAVDGALAAPDASPPDAGAPDAPPIPPGEHGGVACGALTCAVSCCFVEPALYQCDLPACAGKQRMCDGPEDCADGEDCCASAGETMCAPAGSCTAEVCHELDTCDEDDHDTCGTRSNQPYPICYDD